MEDDDLGRPFWESEEAEVGVANEDGGVDIEARMQHNVLCMGSSLHSYKCHPNVKSLLRTGHARQAYPA